MFPIIPFVAWVGGISAGAQIATGVVKGVKEVCRGRPVAGLVEVADGVAAPILTACNEVSKLGHEIFLAVTSPWNEESKEEPKELAPARAVKSCCHQEHAEEGGSLNGVHALAAKG